MFRNLLHTFYGFYTMLIIKVYMKKDNIQSLVNIERLKDLFFNPLNYKH